MKEPTVQIIVSLLNFTGNMTFYFALLSLFFLHHAKLIYVEEAAAKWESDLETKLLQLTYVWLVFQNLSDELKHFNLNLSPKG